MLTVRINDSGLERRIVEKARTIGKSTQEFVHDVLDDALTEDSDTGLIFEKLDIKNNGYTMVFSKAEDSVLAEDAEPYSYVTDSATYTEQLRKKAWRK
ncbi:hypothetical protein [Olivibacter sitiensis]|uniref:hypothetical protein n=1 Tax=Olivibacter sitiensis TaxID=376470 RepID=UPI00048062E0|nr:hypothetical protein [Olivibacter sitiensis]